MCIIIEDGIITYFFSFLLLWKCKIIQSPYKIVWQMLKIELPYEPAGPILHIYPKEIKTNVYIKPVHKYLK